MDTTKLLTFLALGGIIYYYYKSWKKYNTEQSLLTWPRKYPVCPDYWTETKDGKCKNVFGIGECPKDNMGKVQSGGIISFKETNYTGKDGNTNKCRWAKRCKNSWEGIDKMCA
tara:strand:- start:173 stop:511 length:339 start_codon:yes stop_codon:yes gene_type:complete